MSGQGFSVQQFLFVSKHKDHASKRHKNYDSSPPFFETQLELYFLHLALQLTEYKEGKEE